MNKLYFIEDHDGINTTLKGCSYIVAYYNSTFNYYFKMDMDGMAKRGVLVSGNSETLTMLTLQGYAIAVDYKLLSSALRSDIWRVRENPL